MHIWAGLHLRLTHIDWVATNDRGWMQNVGVVGRTCANEVSSRIQVYECQRHGCEGFSKTCQEQRLTSRLEDEVKQGWAKEMMMEAGYYSD